MSLVTWTWQPLSIALLSVGLIAYVHGWRKLRRAVPGLATRYRLAAFGGSAVVVGIVLLSPIYALSEYFLSARAVQKVLICMVAPPLFWLACPMHTVLWGLPGRWRRLAAHHLVRTSMLRRRLRALIQPGSAWLLFVTLFLLWHEPGVAMWTLQSGTLHSLSIWVLLGAALLYWRHVVGTGLRMHVPLSVWAAFAYIIGVEVPNMLAGVSIAFSTTPLYAYYESVQASLPAIPGALAGVDTLNDQMLSGGIIWIAGSIIYISTIVVVLNRLFQQEGEPPPQLQFSREADHRTIAPGLEYRVRRSQQQKMDSCVGHSAHS